MASFPTRDDAGGGVTLIPLPGEARARELGHTAEIGGPAWIGCNRARFYGSDMRFLSYSKPAPDKGTSSLGASLWYIRPC